MLTTVNLDMHPILPNQAGPNGEKILGKAVGLLTLTQGTIDVSSPGIEGMTGVQKKLFWKFSQFGQVIDSGSAEQRGNRYLMFSSSGNTYLKDFNFLNQRTAGDMFELYDEKTNGILGVCVIVVDQTGVLLPQRTFSSNARFHTLTGAFM